MKQVIKFIDKNVDGCGTNVEVLIQVEGKLQLTSAVLQETKDVIKRYKIENDLWCTDEVVDEACKFLETKGYMCNYAAPQIDAEIWF